MSKCYNKAYESFLSALRVFSAMGSNAELRSLKWLFIVRMLSPFNNDAARGVRLSKNDYPEVLTLKNLFSLFQKNDIVGFEDNLFNDEKDKALKKYFGRVHTALRKNVLLNELPLRGTISFSALSEKLNRLDEGKVEKLVLALISEKKIDGTISHGNTREYIGPYRPKPDPMQNASDSIDDFPFFYVAESNHVLPISVSAAESFTPNKDVDSSNALQTFSQLETSNDGKACQDMLSAVATSMVAGCAKIIHEAREKYPSFAKHVDITSSDELIQSMISFLNQQHNFKALNISSFVDTGYHYTKPEFAASIRTNGLKRSERGFFGPGVYTGNYTNAFATNSKSVGLILLRLQGKKSYSIDLYDVEGFVIDQCYPAALIPRESFNTVIGNKARVNSQWPVDDYNDEIILQDPAQCLPVVIFDNPCSDIFGEECIGYIQKSLQDMMDAHLNVGSTPAGTESVVESDEKYNPVLRSVCYDRILRNDLSRTSPLVHNYNAPNNLGDIVINSMGNIPQCKYDQKQECPICFEELGPTAHTLRSLSCSCVHIFHQDCIQKSIESSPRCPTCQTWVKEPQGKSPSGRMCLAVIPKKCSGYDEDTIQIHYQIYAAMQKPYHPYPNVRHSSKNVKAYLPNNDDGKNLLKRLRYAFEHGLTFTVGTSMTTRLDNQCIWASIHHKTSLTGGTAKHGYPDPSYFFNCNEELNMLGVPPADVLPEVVLLDDKPWMY
ncbi:hypothetical protein CTEN210_06426 [Chaetoceros tenuissimus]|nr:hypothetical protein CTEN210_06426 [Chaetoceros tenuissimus]